MSTSTKTERLNDFIGLPIGRGLKRRIKAIAESRRQKTAPMVRILLEQAVEAVEKAPGAVEDLRMTAAAME